MKDFCHHCGRELSGTEDRCPECGSPTGLNSTAGTSSPGKEGHTPNNGPSGSTINPRTAVLVGIIVVCLLGMILIPSLTKTNESDKYTIGVTVEEISIKDSSSDHVYGSSIPTLIYIATESNMSNYQTLGKWNSCPTDGTTYIPTDKCQTSFEYSGDLKDLKLYVYFKAVTKMEGDAIKSMDDIDIYSQTDISGNVPKYIGCSGVMFTYSDIQDGHITLKGDSDPIGTVKLEITAVKK